MKFNPGIVTEKLIESRDFYCLYLGFKVKFENDFYVLLENPESIGHFEISFLQPMHPTQNQIFQKDYKSGAYLTIEVSEIKFELNRLKKLDCKIHMDIKEEEWGDTHFIILDPNGLGIDLVQYNSPS